MKPLPDLPQCQFSAFVSYAHADDEAWNHWITDFSAELERGLRSRLRGLNVPRVHQSGDNGPVAGSLSDELKERIEASFAMIIIVHDNYVMSQWCRNELVYFKSLFGDAGLRERLYIVALSEPAMQQVTKDPVWRELVPDEGQVWMPFFRERERDTPLLVYHSPNRMAPDFVERFNDLREHLVKKLKPSAAPATLTRVAAAPAAAAPAAPVTTAPRSGGVLVGITSPALKEGAAALVGRLRELGLESRAIERGAEDSDFADFDGADALVLPFDDSPLLMPFYAGGHLGLQRDSWLRKGKPEERLHWLDIRPPGSGAAQGSAAFVAGAGVTVRNTEALLAELKPVSAPAATGRGVCVYIESNRLERNLWEPLGDQIRRTWDEIFDDSDADNRPPPLFLRTRGLPVDQIDQFPTLEDADGVVLLWGKKTPEALVAQIHKIEGKLQGRDGAPGMVAYLMPPQPVGDEPIPAWGWKVLRFNAPDEDNIGVLASECTQLKRFLRQVAERSRRREQAGARR